MQMVLLTALGVGGATIFGSVMGFAFKKISHRFSDIVLSLAAGVMMCAAILGLILPSLEYEGPAPLLVTINPFSVYSAKPLSHNCFTEFSLAEILFSG